MGYYSRNNGDGGLGMNINEKGQAALIDSLFFIVIVAAICTGLFYFAINYGSSPDVLINSFYSSDFAMDALKVITYVNVMRDGSPISPSGNYTTATFPEYDYLLALLKEDYAETSTIGVQSKKAIANTVYSALKPFDDSLDYVFYIAKEQTSVSDAKYMAMVIAVHDPYVPNQNNDELLTDPPNRVFYDCNPQRKNILEEKFFPELGSVESAYGKITLMDSPYIIGLHTWVAKNVEVINYVKDPANMDYNCSVLITMQRDPSLDYS
jgi:hypothetical protein